MTTNYQRWIVSGVAAGAILLSSATLSLAQSGGAVISATAPATVPGATVTVTGSGFNGGETVFLTFGAQTTSVVADGGGNFTTSALSVPSVPSGSYFISAFGTQSGKWTLYHMWVSGYSPTVTPSSWYINPGAPLTFIGSGFGPNEQIDIRFNDASIASTTSDASGNINVTSPISLPSSVNNTTAVITFVGASSTIPVMVPITVGQLYLSITPSTWYTTPGSIISVTGSGFAAGEQVLVSTAVASTTVTADSPGNFLVPSLALPMTGGDTPLTAVGQTSGATATVLITMTGFSPWITFSTYWAQAGAALTIFGNAFAGNEIVTAFYSGTPFASTTSDTSGNFSASTMVPYAPAGGITIVATGAASGASASGNMTIAQTYTNLQLQSYAVPRGSAVTFLGSGYIAHEPIEVRTDRTGSTVVHTFNADASGNFTNSGYTIPSDFAEGNLTLMVKGLYSFDEKSITLYVQII